VPRARGSDSRRTSVIVFPPEGPPVRDETPVDVSFSRLKVLIGFDFGS